MSMLLVEFFYCTADPERVAGILLRGGYRLRRNRNRIVFRTSIFAGRLLERDRVQIGAKSCARFIALDSAQHDEKSFLGQFFGARRVVQSPAKKSEDGLAVATEKLREGCLRAALEIEDEPFVARHFRVGRCAARGEFIKPSTLHSAAMRLPGRKAPGLGDALGYNGNSHARGPSLCVMPYWAKGKSSRKV